MRIYNIVRKRGEKMKLLSEKGVLSPKQSKTNTAFEFSVPENVKELHISYSYYPKTVEDKERALRQLEECIDAYSLGNVNAEDFLPVNNLVTLSFDSPEGYIGACHRQKNEQEITIGEKSTPGINGIKIKSGVWKVTLNAHYIGCNISYSLEVEEVEI